MGDSLEVRISTVEHIQEEFGHDIQEMKRQLARLTKLIEGHTAIMLEGIHGSSFNPLQSSSYPLVQHQHLHSDCEPHIPVRGNVPPRVHHPNWQSHAPTRQPFQLLERRPNQLILRTVQGIISGNQEGIEKRRDWILFQSHTPSYFPNY